MTNEQKQYMDTRLNQFTMELGEHMAQTVQGAVRAAVADAVKVNVNGKIDSLRGSLEAYKTEDAEWKERAEPMIKTYEGAGWALKSLVGLITVLASVGAILEVAYKLVTGK